MAWPAFINSSPKFCPLIFTSHSKRKYLSRPQLRNRILPLVRNVLVNALARLANTLVSAEPPLISGQSTPRTRMGIVLQNTPYLQAKCTRKVSPSYTEANETLLKFWVKSFSWAWHEITKPKSSIKTHKHRIEIFPLNTLQKFPAQYHHNYNLGMYLLLVFAK